MTLEEQQLNSSDQQHEDDQRREPARHGAGFVKPRDDLGDDRKPGNAPPSRARRKVMISSGDVGEEKIAAARPSDVLAGRNSLSCRTSAPA